VRGPDGAGVRGALHELVIDLRVRSLAVEDRPAGEQAGPRKLAPLDAPGEGEVEGHAREVAHRGDAVGEIGAQGGFIPEVHMQVVEPRQQRAAFAVEDRCVVPCRGFGVRAAPRNASVPQQEAGARSGGLPVVREVDGDDIAQQHGAAGWCCDGLRCNGQGQEEQKAIAAEHGGYPGCARPGRLVRPESTRVLDRP